MHKKLSSTLRCPSGASNMKYDFVGSIFHDHRAELLETHYLSNLVRGISVDELDANPRAKSSLTVIVG